MSLGDWVDRQIDDEGGHGFPRLYLAVGTPLWVICAVLSLAIWNPAPVAGASAALIYVTLLLRALERWA